MYVPVPPEATTVSVVGEFTVTGLAVAVNEVTEIPVLAGLTTSERLFEEVFAFASVAVNVTVKVPDVEGLQVSVRLLVLVQPDGNPV